MWLSWIQSLTLPSQFILNLGKSQSFASALPYPPMFCQLEPLPPSQAWGITYQILCKPSWAPGCKWTHLPVCAYPEHSVVSGYILGKLTLRGQHRGMGSFSQECQCDFSLLVCKLATRKKKNNNNTSIICIFLLLFLRLIWRVAFFISHV